MIIFFSDENWKELEIKSKSGLRYAISNYGRMVSFTDSISNGRLLKCGVTKGYKVFRERFSEDGKPVSRSYYLHKLVANYFLPPNQPNQKFAIHLDYVKDNNHYKNLKWASKEEVEAHQDKNPIVIKERQRLREHNRINEYKLTEQKVRIIKRKLSDPNRRTRIKMIARQFGVSEMQLYRIKTGENWGHVK